MGGDHGCEVVVEGVKLALDSDAPIDGVYLVGDAKLIERALAGLGWRDQRLEIVHASEVLTMEDKPIVGLKRKRDCSIARAVELVKEGRAAALVSPGNTGGVVAASTLKLRPLPGVDRPGIATVMPTPEREFVLLDAGANIDCRPLHLVHYAIMGNIYSREVLGCKEPRVGLLSVGTEEIKGNELTLEAFRLCKQLDLRFIGNVEGHDLFANHVDVVVCDGFVGNVVLKTCESLATALFAWLKQELTHNAVRKAGAWLARDAFRAIKARVDPDTYGGAPLLGLNGNVTIAHGSANRVAIRNAIRFCANAALRDINRLIQTDVARANETLSDSKSAGPVTSPA